MIGVRRKSQLTFHLEGGFRYEFKRKRNLLAPYITYRISPALFYNQTLPFNVYTQVSLGLSLHLASQS